MFVKSVRISNIQVTMFTLGKGHQDFTADTVSKYATTQNYVYLCGLRLNVLLIDSKYMCR